MSRRRAVIILIQAVTKLQQNGPALQAQGVTSNQALSQKRAESVISFCRKAPIPRSSVRRASAMPIRLHRTIRREDELKIVGSNSRLTHHDPVRTPVNAQQIWPGRGSVENTVRERP